MNGPSSAHIAFVSDYVATPNTSGAGLHLWAVVRQAIAMGHSVSYLIVGRPHEFQVLDALESAKMLHALEALGVRVVRADFTRSSAAEAGPSSSSLPSRSLPERLRLRARRVLAPISTDFDVDFDVEALRLAIEDALDSIDPDIVFAFNDGPIAALAPLTRFTRVAWPSDPIHLLYRSRWKHGTWKLRARASLGAQLLSYRRYPEWIVTKLSGYQGVIHQAAHHAAWFRNRGVQQCQYIPTPVVDPFTTDSGGRPERTQSGMFKILHLGHLGGTASMTGLPVFLEETLPVLEREIGAANFEVHFVGRVDVGDEMSRRLAHPSIRIRGFVDDLAEEFRSSDVFLVPIPHEVGSRTRLLTAMAYGSCAVAHQSSRLGNPELQHGQNVLLAPNGHGLAREILKVWRNPDLRAAIGQSARETYERYFSEETAGRSWVEAIVAAGAAGAGAPSAVSTSTG